MEMRETHTLQSASSIILYLAVSGESIPLHIFSLSTLPAYLYPSFCPARINYVLDFFIVSHCHLSSYASWLTLSRAQQLQQ